MLSTKDNTDGKRKTVPSIPANYISILDLQERWLKEKELKRKEEEEEEERRRKQQVEEEQKIKEDLKKAEEVRKQLEKEKRLDRSNRWKKELNDGGEAKFAEKEVFIVTTAIGSGGDTAERLPEKKNRGFRRKRYTKKKKIPDVAVVKDVVDYGCGGSITSPENVVTENITPVKEVIQDYKKKGEKSTGKKSVIYREKTVTKAIETQIENLSIKNLKSQKTKSSHRNQRVTKPIGDAGSMVWVKKDKANDGGIASGCVKPFNAVGEQNKEKKSTNLVIFLDVH